jgi:hypothetical protein
MFMPIILSHLRLEFAAQQAPDNAQQRHPLWWKVSGLAQPGPALATFAVMLVLLGAASAQVGLIPHPLIGKACTPGSVHAFFGVWWANRQRGDGQEFVYGWVPRNRIGRAAVGPSRLEFYIRLRSSKQDWQKR